MWLVIILASIFSSVAVSSGESERVKSIKEMVVNLLAESEQEVTAMASSPDGAYVAAGLANADIFLIYLPNNNTATKLKNNRHANYISSLAFSPDGKFLISGSGDNKLTVWRVAGGNPVFCSDEHHRSRITAVGFTQDLHFVSASQSEVLDWQWAGPDKSQQDAVNTTQLPVRLNNLILEYLDEWKLGRELVKEKIKIAKIEDRKIICTKPNDKIIIIDLASQRKFTSVLYKNISALAIFEKFIAIGQDDGKIIVQDIVDRTEKVVSTGRTSPHMVNSLNFNVDGSHLVAATQRKVSVWDMKTHKRVKAICDPQHFAIASLTISRSGRYLAIGNTQAQLRILPNTNK